MPHTITSKDHPSSMAERIEKRLRPSNDIAHADVVKHMGHSTPTRTITSVHHSGNHVKPPDTRDTNIRDTVRKP